MKVAFIWLPLIVYASKTVLLFGTQDSATQDVAKVLAQRDSILPYTRYSVNEHFSVIDTESYDLISTESLRRKLLEHKLTPDTVDFIIMAEDAVMETTRILKSEQTLRQVLPMDNKKILGIVTRSDEDDFCNPESRLSVFRQRQIIGLSVGQQCYRDILIQQIMAMMGPQAKPFSVPFFSSNYDHLLSSLSGWTRSEFPVSSIKTTGVMFISDGIDRVLTEYSLGDDQVLVDPSHRFAARIAEGQLFVRQEDPNFNIVIDSELPVHFGGNCNSVTASGSEFYVENYSTFASLTADSVHISQSSNALISDVNCRELTTKGELTLRSGKISGSLYHSGSLNWESDEPLYIPTIHNNGHIRGRKLQADHINNKGALDFSENITAGLIFLSEDAVIYAPTIKVTDETPLALPKVEAEATPGKIYLAFGHAGSSKSMAGKIFGACRPFLNDNKWLDDRVIIHNIAEVAIIEVLAHDAHFWLPDFSPQQVVVGISQVLSRYGRSSIDGVLLFESLSYDYSCTKRTVHQASTVLTMLGSALSPKSTIMIYSKAADVNEETIQEGRGILALEGNCGSCFFADAAQSIQNLVPQELVIKSAPADVIDIALYHQVQCMDAPFSAALINHGYMKTSKLNSKSTLNTGLLLIDSELGSGETINYGLIKAQTSIYSMVANYGSFSSNTQNLVDVRNAGVMNLTSIQPLENGRLLNLGIMFALKSSSPIPFIDNHGKLTMKVLDAGVVESSGQLTAVSAIIHDFNSNGETKIRALKVKNTLSSTGSIKSDSIDASNCITSESSYIESSTFKSNGFTVHGKFDVALMEITGDVAIAAPAHIKELSCTGAVELAHSDAVIGSLSCRQSSGCALVRAVTFACIGQEITVPASTSPLRLTVKGGGSTLLLNGSYFIDELKTASDTKVITRGDVVLTLSSDLFLANLVLEGNLTLKGGKSLYTGNLNTSTGSLLTVEGEGSIAVSSRLSPTDTSHCNVLGEVRSFDFATDGSNFTLEGIVRAAKEVEIISPVSRISGGIQAGSEWKIVSDDCTINRLPSGPGYIHADNLTTSQSLENHQASIIVEKTFTGPSVRRLELFEYRGQSVITLESVNIKALVVPSAAELILNGAGCIDGIDACNVPIRVRGDYTGKAISGRLMMLTGSLTLRDEGVLDIEEALTLNGRLFAKDSHIAAASMTSTGLCSAKSLLIDELGEFSTTSHTTAHGLQSKKTKSWSPLGVVDIGFIDLPAAERFTPHLLYTAVIKGPNMTFAPLEKGLVSVKPDEHHKDSFVYCKDYVLPTYALESDKISDVVFHRLFGRWPEDCPVSIRQTKFDSATTVRFADTLVQASTTAFPSDLTWDGIFKISTGSDLSIERFCKWDGTTLLLKAPNMTVRGKLTLSGNLFADIENRILIERCQDKWVERVVEKSRKRTLCYSRTKRSVRTFNMGRSDADGGVVNVVEKVGLKSTVLELNAGQVMAGNDLDAKAKLFKGRANVDTRYEMDSAKGGNFWGSRSDHYSRQIQDVHAPTLASGGKKTTEFGEMDVEATQMVSRQDITAHVTGNATLKSVTSVTEGKRKIKSSGFGVTSCKQETVKRVTPSTFASTDGNAAMKVNEHLKSEGTNWMAKRKIDIEAQSADFPAAYAEIWRKTEFEGMQDPLSYTKGTVDEHIRQAMPNRFITTDERNTHVRIHTTNELGAEAPIFDTNKAWLKSENESVKIRKAVNSYESVSDTFMASINFFGSDALRAAAKGEKGWGCKLLDEVPLLGAIKGMAQARGNQQMICAGVNTAIATVGTLKELAACDGIGDYFVGRLCRVELAVTMTHEEQTVLQEVGMVMARPNSSLRVEAKKDVSIGGLSGQLDSLFTKGSKVTFDPLKSESWFSNESVSMGISFNFAAYTPGASFGIGEASGHSVTHQSAPLTARSLGIQADEEVEIGTFIKAISTFVETKKLVLKSHMNLSKSKNFNASINVGLPSLKKGGDQNGSIGGSMGFGSSRVKDINLAGIESETIHVKTPVGIELHGAVLRLTESANSIPGDDGNSWYEFSLPESLVIFTETAVASEDEAAAAIREWAQTKGQSVQLWHAANDRFSRSGFIQVENAEMTVNILLRLSEGNVSASLLNQQPGVIETSYTKSFDMKTKHRESYIGVGVSDIMSCASCAGYLSIDYKQLRKTAINHAMASAGLDFGAARFEGDRLARSEAERVRALTSRDIDISIKALPIITDFSEYFDFLKQPTKLLKEIRDAIWDFFEAELEEELTGDISTKDDRINPAENMTEEEIDAKLEESLKMAEEIYQEEKAKAKSEQKQNDEEKPESNERENTKESENTNEQDFAEAYFANAEAKQKEGEQTFARTFESNVERDRQEQEATNADEPTFNYMDILNTRLAQGDLAQEDAKDNFMAAFMANRTRMISQDDYPNLRDQTPSTTTKSEDGYYKKTVMGLIWLAEGSEDTLRFLDAAKSKYSLARLLMKATPAKIFVDVIGKELSKTLLREVTKETVVRAMSEAMFLSIADPNFPLTQQTELSKRVHKAAKIMYDWYALVVTSKGLKEDLKDFGGDVKKWGKKSWKAIKKSGALNWFKAKFSQEELTKKSELVFDTMVKRAEMDIKDFNKNPKRFLKNYKERFYERTVGHTPMAETMYKGTKNIYSKYGEKIGEAIDLID